MPQFTTISPTHIAGQKPGAWERFRDGRYVAIGWLEDVDLTNKSMEEITDLIRKREYDNEAAAIQSFERFLSLKVGDYVAVNNTNHGLFGVGKITSGYKFELGKHDSGDGEDLYPHYRDVEWIKTSFMPRTSLVSEGETPWQPYGTVGKVYPELPPYIARLVGISPPTTPKPIANKRPAFLKSVIEAVETLRKEREHKERAHESLVEDFFVALGYRKHTDIKYRQGRVDIKIETDGLTLLIAEVKAVWDLSFCRASVRSAGMCSRATAGTASMPTGEPTTRPLSRTCCSGSPCVQLTGGSRGPNQKFDGLTVGSALTRATSFALFSAVTR